MPTNKKYTKDKLAKMRNKIIDSRVNNFEEMFTDAKAIMTNRTANYKFYDKVAHMQNLYDAQDVIFSEGSTQSIERKIRAQTLQRPPDGEIISQHDSESIEQAVLEYLFKNKILRSEYSGKDRLKDIWRTFDSAFMYGFGCVRTGFEKDMHNEIRVSYKEIPYNMVFPNPDCDYIEEADWYIVEEMISLSFVNSLLDEKGVLIDKTYNQDTIDYLMTIKYTDPNDTIRPNKLEDEDKGVTDIESFKVRTLYRRGDDTFITYIPSLSAVFREVKNFDPQKDVPIHFLILEPDPSFPLGCSSVMWTLSKQQFADAFQSSAYQTLLLATNPPLMGFGNLTPAAYKMLPGAWWNLGTNQNNQIEKFTVETTTITQYGSIIDQISSSMNKDMNIMDQTIASDAHVPGWSKTPQGVEQQQADKTITVNQYQKRVEIFFSEWANHALRSYISSLSGKQYITVDEETRRKIDSYEQQINSNLQKEGKPPIKSIIKDNKIIVNFSDLSADRLEFQVRSGSLVQGRKEEQRQALQELLVSVSQMMGNVSEQNRSAFEQTLLQMIERLIELSDIDFSAEASNRFNEELYIESLFTLAKQLKSTGTAVQQIQQVLTSGISADNNNMQDNNMNSMPGQQQQQIPPQLEAAAPQQAQQPQEVQQPNGEELNGDAAPLPPEIMDKLINSQNNNSDYNNQAQQQIQQTEEEPVEQ